MPARCLKVYLLPTPHVERLSLRVHARRETAVTMERRVDESGRIRRPRWYVVQVERGRERVMARRLSRVIPAGLIAEPVFQPTFEAEIKVRGEWLRVEKPLTEGYLIAVSSDAEGLEKALQKEVCEFTRLLGTSAGPSPLAEEEAELFGALGKPGHRCVALSRGCKLPDGSIVVTSGPLKGKENLIHKVNRHKSLAFLQIDVCGTPLNSRAGLVLVSAGAEGRVPAREVA